MCYKSGQIMYSYKQLKVRRDQCMFAVFKEHCNV